MSHIRDTILLFLLNDPILNFFTLRINIFFDILIFRLSVKIRTKRKIFILWVYSWLLNLLIILVFCVVGEGGRIFLGERSLLCTDLNRIHPLQQLPQKFPYLKSGDESSREYFLSHFANKFNLISNPF